MPTPTGPELRRERRDADVYASDIAKRAGWSRAWVHVIEKSATPTQAQIDAYRKALTDAVASRES